jgi:hypothetical protein
MNFINSKMQQMAQSTRMQGIAWVRTSHRYAQRIQGIEYTVLSMTEWNAYPAAAATATSVMY